MYPFILRGVRLIGIDSAWQPAAVRSDIWEQLAGAWKLDCLADITQEISLAEVPSTAQRMLHGEITGRVVVRMTAD